MIKTPIKIGIAGGTLVVGAGGGVGIWGLTTKSNSDSISPKSEVSELVAMSGEDDYQTTYSTNNTAGKKYGRYFLSPNSNQEEWNKRYEQNKSRFFGWSVGSLGKFKSVVKGYDDNDNTALNKVCESAYKEAESSKLLMNEDSNGNGITATQDQFKMHDIWAYCGIYNPEIVEEASEYTLIENTIGFSNKDMLISIDSKNDGFWKIRAEEFWSNEGDRSKSKVQGTGSKFANLKTQTTKGSMEDLKNACDEIYKKQSSDDTDNKHQADALLFCSIKLDIS